MRRFAWYSAKMEKHYGSVLWRHIDGYPVIVTCIGDSPIKAPSMWGDEKLQGEVTEHLSGSLNIEKHTHE
jgi:hypothetical protein